ncbi:MAG: cellulase family glycosylhydrolase [Chloroflexota bacterium]|nr:cellulase family glycosylhydrolase [Chloroflexota bacterium]MDQ6905718.1 cellulase family glycosylhydrolase [Chloroflexota bacterium]
MRKRARLGGVFSLLVLLFPLLCSLATVRAAGPFVFDPLFQPFASGVGTDTLGLPISALITRDGMRYQYTERARLEMPVNGGTVQLARAGAILSSGRDFKQLASPSVNPDTRYFPETNHSLAYGFRSYWEQHGDVGVFGLPISEEFGELNPADGKTYDVQYFERAKFERHPEFTGTPNEIQLAFLGKQLYQFYEGVGMPGVIAQAPGLKTPFNPDIGIVTEFTNQPRDRLLKMVGDLGVHWVRQPVQWFALEPSPGQYDFGGLDLLLNDLKVQGVNVLLTVSGSPKWATAAGDNGAPRDPADFARFMSVLSAKFSGRVGAYEVWNEPNLALEWGPRVDATAYVEMLKAVAPVVRAADPHAIIVAAALGPTGVNDPKIGIDDVRYLEQLESYQNGVYRYMADVQGSHPYGYRSAPDMLPPEKANIGEYTAHPSFYFRRIEQQRLVMIRAGDGGRAMWVTEFGWGSGNFPEFSDVSEQTRAAWMTQSVQQVRARYPWVGLMLVWNLNWSVFSPSDVSWGYFSVVNADYSPRPAYYAVKALSK